MLTRRRKRLLLFSTAVISCVIISILQLIFAVIPQDKLMQKAVLLHLKSSFQPRSISYSVFSYINEKIRHGDEISHILGDKDGIFFHWDDWIDLTAGDAVLYPLKQDFSDSSGKCPDSIAKFASVDPYFPESYPTKVLRCMAYAYCHKDIPSRVLVSTDSGYIQVPVKNRKRVGHVNLARDVTKTEVIGEMEHLEHVFSVDDFQTQLLSQGFLHVPYSKMRSSVEVKSSDFVFDPDHEMFLIKEKLRSHDLLKTEADSLLSLQHGNEIADNAAMFFKYPSVYFDFVTKRSHHFYYPFFKRFFGDRERQAVLQHLVKNWFRFAETEKVASWVNYGSLLGWAFNGVNMPWDTDVDVQLPIAHLHRLSVKYNNTLIMENPRDGNGVYLFEVTPTYVRQGNGKNFIDARLIDVNTGLYIDISGVSYTRHVPPAWMHSSQDISDKLKTMAVHCKNWNWHLLEELLPIRRTFFEGSSIYIPHNVTSILDRKYGPSSYTTDLAFKRHHYRADLGLWIPDNECRPDPLEIWPHDVEGSILAKCGKSWVFDEYLIVSPSYKRHCYVQEDAKKYVILDDNMEDLPLTRKDHWDFFDDFVNGRSGSGEWRIT